MVLCGFTDPFLSEANGLVKLTSLKDKSTSAKKINFNPKNYVADFLKVQSKIVLANSQKNDILKKY